MRIKDIIEQLSEFDDDAEAFIYMHDRIYSIESIGDAQEDNPEDSAIIYVDDQN